MSQAETPPRTARRGKIRPDQLYVVRISLDGIRPEIWRTVRVPPDLTLGGLHWVLQFAMGWTNSHLHQFVVDGERYSDPRFEMDEFEEEERTGDENDITLREALPRRGSRLLYEYDFGDSWGHTVRLEDAVDPLGVWQRFLHFELIVDPLDRAKVECVGVRFLVGRVLCLHGIIALPLIGGRYRSGPSFLPGGDVPVPRLRACGAFSGPPISLYAVSLAPLT